MTFRHGISLKKEIAHAEIYATALGIYELTLNGKKLGNRYFAPGFTSYKNFLQYQSYDITQLLESENMLYAEVAGGWAVGSFVFTRANRITADRQALLLELRVSYTDGSEEVIGTDEDWEVSLEGPVRIADFYDGETYEARVRLNHISYHQAALEQIKIHPQILADYGLPVIRHECMQAKYLNTIDGVHIYDFGQNFAGVVSIQVNGKTGQKIIIRHAEVLSKDGTLNTSFLRSAKATVTYICRNGEQEYSPRFTYMGFRYISVEGIEPENINITAYALYSDVRDNGSFVCSNEMLNKLNENIRWAAKSNFMDIPTDCPQRDERMGWTGDIALFSPTACYNFDMSRFFNKWLKDLRAEQLKTGGIPNTIPSQSYGFPTTMPTMAVDFWGDACVLVPWAEYLARGDIHILEDMYDSMERYVNACKFWANIWGVGKYRYIWHTPYLLHFGDWVAADIEKMSQWQKRSRWTATASLCHTSAILAQISSLLGKKEKCKKYETLSRKVAQAYSKVFMDTQGKLKKEFQTGYVLPLYFKMLDKDQAAVAATNLAALVKENDYCIGTGFPGTPYILFALADNGYVDVAYKMLLNTKCPSWLYEVRVGATTVWERWDGLDENGVCPIGDDGTGGMISYNHYASGAVGDFLYRRIAGIEARTGGYQTFAVKPVPGGDLTWVKGEVMSPYGKILSDWKIINNTFTITVEVPSGTVCELTMPSGTQKVLSAGSYTFTEEWEALYE